MKLVSVQNGDYSEVEHLNPNFQKHHPKLKITLDTISPREFYLENFPRLMFSIIEMLPNLRYHQCSHGENRHLRREYDLSHLITPIKIIGDVIDTVHLLEHAILELQCQVSDMPVCSGLTCNYWEPENRYDVFVECNEPEVALFSTHAAVAVFNKLLYDDPAASPPLNDLIQIASDIYRHGMRTEEELAQSLNWTAARVSSGLEWLEEFKFPFEILEPVA